MPHWWLLIPLVNTIRVTWQNLPTSLCNTNCRTLCDPLPSFIWLKLLPARISSRLPRVIFGSLDQLVCFWTVFHCDHMMAHAIVFFWMSPKSLWNCLSCLSCLNPSNGAPLLVTHLAETFWRGWPSSINLTIGKCKVFANVLMELISLQSHQLEVKKQATLWCIFLLFLLYQKTLASAQLLSSQRIHAWSWSAPQSHYS